MKQNSYVYILHNKNSKVILTYNLEINADIGAWAYGVDDMLDSTDKVKDQIWINCSHNDLNKL